MVGAEPDGAVDVTRAGNALADRAPSLIGEREADPPHDPRSKVACLSSER